MKHQSLSNPYLIRLINQKLFTIAFSSSILLLKKNGDFILLLQNLYLVQLFHIHTMIIFMHGSSSCYTKMLHIFPGPLTGSFKYFTSVFKTNAYGAKFPATLHFVKNYKVSWILKWQYAKEGDVLTRQWFVKWWDKFSHTQDVIDNVTREFLTASQSTVNTTT